MKKEPIIFVITGKAQSGKDTTADIIKAYLELKKFKVAKIAYAKYIKMYAKDYFGWDGKEKSKPRDLLQMLGTDIRNKFEKPNFFIDRMKEDIEILLNYYDVFIISDARTDKEILMPKENFNKVISLRLLRDTDNELNLEQKENYTETALDGYNNYDHILYNNGSLDELKNRVINIVDDFIK